MINQICRGSLRNIMKQKLNTCILTGQAWQKPKEHSSMPGTKAIVACNAQAGACWINNAASQWTVMLTQVWLFTMRKHCSGYSCRRYPCLYTSALPSKTFLCVLGLTVDEGIVGLHIQDMKTKITVTVISSLVYAQVLSTFLQQSSAGVSP